MSTAAQLTIPPDLKPSDGRFGCGPSKVRPEQVRHLLEHATDVLGTSHRQRPVKAVVGRVREGLRELFALPEGYEVALGNGGTTAFWDAAALGLVRERALHLTYGEFSSKFATVTRGAPFLGDPVVVTADPGDAPARAAGARGRRRDRVGPQRDLDRRDARRGAAGRGGSDALVLVDATSGRRRPARRRRAGRRLLLRAAEVLRRRRRAVARAAEPGRAGAHRRDAGRAGAGSRSSSR